jgi:tRNA pseudouridine55 synthase
MNKERTYDFPEGEVLLIDKPASWTSFDVVNKVRHMLRYHLGIKKIKVGHAGTLDPLATGLLLVCTGRATKRVNEFTGLDKEYTGSFIIGATTPSYDLETPVDHEYETLHITEEMIRDAARHFMGRIVQTPPAYSAIKVEGTRAYRKARMNKDVDLPAREVLIHEFEILSAGVPETTFRVLCSKGTYVRSLVNDFGKHIGSGAYLNSLRRTRIGNYCISEAISFSRLEEILTRQLDK